VGAADRKYFFPMLIEEIPNIRALRTLSQAKHEGQYSPLPSRQHKPAPLIAPNLVVRSQNKRRRHVGRFAPTNIRHFNKALFEINRTEFSTTSEQAG
jgi:hypothetical protein